MTRILNNAVALIVVFVAVSFANIAGAVDVTWADLGSDWATGANWGGSAPGAGDIAVLPNDAAIGFQPNVATVESVQGITIDNTGNDYAITTSGGSLTIGSSGLTVTGGGTTTIAPQLQLSAIQTWDIGAGATVNTTGVFAPGSGGVSYAFTKTGEGTLTLGGSAYGGSLSPQRNTISADQGIMNVQWSGLANGVRATIRALGTSTVNVNSPVNINYHYAQADGAGELIFNTNHVGMERLYTGVVGGGGTITVADGVTVGSYGGPIMTGGTMRTIGTGVLRLNDVTFNKTALTATLDGTIQSRRAGDPTQTGGNGLWLHAANAGAGDYRLDVNATLLDATGGSTGLGLNHGYSGAFHGYGVIRLAGNSTYTGVTRFGAGTLLLGTDAPVNAAGAFGNASSPVTIGFTDRAGQVTVLTDGPYTIARSFDIDEASDAITLGGNTADVSTFSGDVTMTSMTSANLNVTAAADGHVDFGGSILAGQSKGVIKLGPGAVALSGNNSYTGNTTISNGTLVGGSNTAFGTGTLIVNTGTTIGVDNGATITNNTTFGGTYTLVGDGTFKPGNISNLTVGSGSTVSPGFSIGTITVGDVTLQSGSNVIIEIVSDSDYDQFISDGTMTINGGDLTLNFLDEYQPSLAGATYQILGGTIAGTGFDNLILPSLSGLRWDTEDLYVGGSISAIPEPASAALLLMAMACFLRRRR